jgi:hypothetical protein
MTEKYFKILLIALFSFAFLAIFSGACGEKRARRDNYNVSVTAMNSADKGLDLKAVGALLEESKDAEGFEKLLNDSKRGINNLDLDEDGKVDYIKVTEFGDDKIKGFSLSVEVAKGDEQEIATIKIEKTGEGKAKVQYHGNSTIYGHNHYYHSSWGGGGFMLGYLWGAHRPYYSRWGYGSYPSYYRSHNVVNQTSYQNRTRSATQGKKYTSSKVSRVGSNVASPNKGKNARSVKAPLRNPTTSQKAFQKRNPSKQMRSGGFGNKRSSFFGGSSRRGSSVRGGRSFGGK